jgi:hypothetical protein
MASADARLEKFSMLCAQGLYMLSIQNTGQDFILPVIPAGIFSF